MRPHVAAGRDGVGEEHQAPLHDGEHQRHARADHDEADPRRRPDGGDAPGQPFHDPEADRALFDAIAAKLKQTDQRRLVRLPHHINDAAFSAALVQNFREIAG